MKNTFKMLLAAGALAVGAQQAFSVPITGKVTMGGTVELDNMDLGDANAAVAFTDVEVDAPVSDAFAGTINSVVTFNAFSWNPASTPVNPLWTFDNATTGWRYTFNLSSLIVDSQSDTFLNLSGTGTLTIIDIPGAPLSPSPYEPTYGNWSFTISNPGGFASPEFEFGFTSGTIATGQKVPDGGATAMLLGLGFIGAAALRRKVS